MGPIIAMGLSLPLLERRDSELTSEVLKVSFFPLGFAKVLISLTRFLNVCVEPFPYFQPSCLRSTNLQCFLGV